MRIADMQMLRQSNTMSNRGHVYDNEHAHLLMHKCAAWTFDRQVFLSHLMMLWKMIAGLVLLLSGNDDMGRDDLGY